MIPADPVLRFLSKLVEDYADEWCWSGKLFKLRQRSIFLWGDGLSPDTEQSISGQYPMLCKSFSRLLEDQDFLLGDQPSLVDFAFMGPFFRHYFCDPVPAIRYRAYCLQMLEQQYQGLDNNTRLQVDTLFSTPLQLDSQTDSGLTEAYRQQFKIFLLGTPWDRPEASSTRSTHKGTKS
jgi:hypothetical protein